MEQTEQVYCMSDKLFEKYAGLLADLFDEIAEQKLTSDMFIAGSSIPLLKVMQ